MGNEQIVEEARGNRGKIASGIVAAILWLILAAFFAIIGFFFLTKMSEYDSRRNIMYIWFVFALIFLFTSVEQFSWVGLLKAAHIIVYKDKIQGTAIKMSLLSSKEIPFDIKFEEIISIPLDKNISICTKNGEYYIPIERYKADSIRNIIEKSNEKR